MTKLEKRERGRIKVLPIFWGTPYYLRNGKSYEFQIWPVHSGGPSEQKPIKNFREKGAWAYPGTAQFFRIPPIISGTGKATNFKFCMYIYRLNRNNSPLKKSSHERSQGLPKIFRAPIRRAHRTVIFATGQLSCLSLSAYITDSYAYKNCDGITSFGQIGPYFKAFILVLHSSTRFCIVLKSLKRQTGQINITVHVSNLSVRPTINSSLFNVLY